MRDYFQMIGVRITSQPFPTLHHWCFGQTDEQAQIPVSQFMAANPAWLPATADRYELYWSLDKGSFYILESLFGPFFAEKLATGSTIGTIEGGFSYDVNDFLVLKSPRGKERRRFRLVPIKHR